MSHFKTLKQLLLTMILIKFAHFFFVLTTNWLRYFFYQSVKVVPAVTTCIRLIRNLNHTWMFTHSELIDSGKIQQPYAILLLIILIIDSYLSPKLSKRVLSLLFLGTPNNGTIWNKGRVGRLPRKARSCYFMVKPIFLPIV